MKKLFFLLLSLLSTLCINAQCIYSWSEVKEGVDLNCPIQRVASNEDIPITCSMTLPKKFLDSIFNDIIVNPMSYPRGKEYPGEVSDFRIYKYKGTDIVNYQTTIVIIDGDTIAVHDISFSGPQKEWNEDGCYHIKYCPELGILDRYWFNMEEPFYSRLRSNSCFSEKKNEVLGKKRAGGLQMD